MLPDINLGLMLPEILIAVVAMALLLASAWWSGEEGKRRINGVATITILAAAVIGHWAIGPDTRTTFGGMFVQDSFAAYMKLLILLATVAPLMMSWDYIERTGIGNGEYVVLTMFAMLGGMIMVSSGGFITLYMGLEMMSLSIYVLAAYKRDDPRSNEAGLKYFVLGSVASALFLYGVTLIYGAVGDVSFTSVTQFLATDHHLQLPINMGLIFIISGLAFKMAAAPFHMWAPDVYEGAPTSVTAFMAAMPKLAAFGAMYRVLMDGFAPLASVWVPVLQVVALLSIGVGALAALRQENIKRLLAYSSVSHVGYALIGLAVGGEMGHKAVVTYLTIYIVMSIGAFALIVGLNKAGVGEKIDDYKGLYQKRPAMALVMAVFMFSMAGIPPLAGFIAKFQIFMAAVQAHMYLLAIVGILFSAVAAYYYLRVVKVMFFDEPESELDTPVGGYNTALMAVSAILVFVWGIMPGAMMGWSAAAIQPFLQ
ncbi:NADH-quinone oxidoreductase subunit NuoN [Magnetofaba australis]|uniref:NADH-quinone oxidoreductase subunit N n=1 Tax=Magnetofaba australis IT-1 TaxID=1434232 RepID=A0A1Y2K7C1_9PROT|nr:NADH-quinone oxidoreductase subunit NuoN [Magnetofaba australis]OSM06229.1 putative proton-translocating NADH-quinone oxidoreductase, chain N [Magnetofaba australis IT-1]